MARMTDEELAKYHVLPAVRHEMMLRTQERDALRARLAEALRDCANEHVKRYEAEYRVADVEKQLAKRESDEEKRYQVFRQVIVELQAQLAEAAPIVAAVASLERRDREHYDFYSPVVIGSLIERARRYAAEHAAAQPSGDGGEAV